MKSIISAQDETRNIPQSIYHDRVVKLKLQQRPWLESLHQLMDPNANGFAVDLAIRMEQFDVKVIHFPESGEPESVTLVKCSTPEEFEEAVNLSGDKQQTGTIVIAKGMSRAMIEALGTRFEIEPEFFANHLAGTELYRMGSKDLQSLRAPARAPRLLPSYIRKAQFYAAEYRRSYRIEGGWERIIKLRSEISNPRGIQPAHRDLPDIFVSEKISVYKKKGSNIGIILTDQLLSDAPPASLILSPVTLLDGDAKNLGIDVRQQQVSARRELISWLQRLTPHEVKDLFNDHEQLAMPPILKIVESNGVMSLAYARHIINRILAPSCDDQFPNNIPFFLLVSRSLERQLNEQKKNLCDALFTASLRCGDDDDLAEQKQDFSFLGSDIAATLSILKENVTFLVAEASIREGKIVGWVSKFAALFLPVSLLATILSISDPGYARWSILGGLSLPFVLISVYFMFFWKPAYFYSLESY